MSDLTEIAAEMHALANDPFRVSPSMLDAWADALDAAAKEQDRLNAHGMAYTDSIRKRSDDQAAEIERLRHHHCSNCGRRSEFISRCDPCLTKKLAGMERLIAEQQAEIDRLAKEQGDNENAIGMLRHMLAADNDEHAKQAAEIERLRAELTAIKDNVLDTVHGHEFLHARRNVSFQLQGMYDGAMSEKCKQMFRDEFDLLTGLLNEFRAAASLPPLKGTP